MSLPVLPTQRRAIIGRMISSRWPLSSIVLTALGVLCALLGIAAMIGLMRDVHPLLNDGSTALALLVSAVALLLSTAFPLVLRSLAESEASKQ